MSESTHPALEPTDGEVPREVSDVLAATRPWLVFFGVTSIIGCGVSFAVGITAVIIGALEGSETDEQTMMIVAGLIYSVPAIFYLWPSILLLRYAGRIARLRDSGTRADLVASMRLQRSFWKILGLIMIGAFVLIPATIALGIVLSRSSS